MSRIEKRVTLTRSSARLFTYVPENVSQAGLWPNFLEMNEVPCQLTGCVEYILQWKFQRDVPTLKFVLSDDYTYWSIC